MSDSTYSLEYLLFQTNTNTLFRFHLNISSLLIQSLLSPPFVIFCEVVIILCHIS
nr:MAG TPA: hypothetical protein [Caudoviricetes sp.]